MFVEKSAIVQVFDFSTAGMVVYPHAETAGGRKAPRHEIEPDQRVAN